MTTLLAQAPGREVRAFARRAYSRDRFELAYQRAILGNRFSEVPIYYRVYKARYRGTLEQLSHLPLPHPARILEVGGGQMLLLCRELFGDSGRLVDLNDDCREAVVNAGLEFGRLDLLHDDLPDRDEFDAILMCEVIEHLPIPPHLVLAKMKQWLKPGGYLFLTTPNLHRPRNLLRLLLGKQIFCPFRYPQRGQGIGHPVEYSAEHMEWQLHEAGFEKVQCLLRQWGCRGSSLTATLGRLATAPLAIRARWRECIIAWGRKTA